jgi:hypothetical protein
MKKLLATSAALATVLAAISSPAFAAHRAPVGHDTMTYGQASSEEMLARPSDLAITEGRVVGADPDVNIRTQLIRDQDQGGF